MEFECILLALLDPDPDPYIVKTQDAGSRSVGTYIEYTDPQHSHYNVLLRSAEVEGAIHEVQLNIDQLQDTLFQAKEVILQNLFEIFI